MPGITALAGARHHIGFSWLNAVAETEGIKKEIKFLEVGREYPSAMHLKIAAGRSFNANMESDYHKCFTDNGKDGRRVWMEQIAGFG